MDVDLTPSRAEGEGREKRRPNRTAAELPSLSVHSNDDILGVLVDTCDQQARLFLDCPPGDLDEASWLDAPRPFAADARDWNTRNGDTDPAGWMSRAVVSYLSEASHQLAALALLLRSRAVHATLDPLVRAVLERCGRVCWLIDHQATGDQRAVRAQLELGVCALHYAAALSLIGGPDDVTSRSSSVAGRASFPRTRAPRCRDERREEGHVCVDGRWRVVPRLHRDRCPCPRSSPAVLGVYAGLSGFAHPNVFFAAERRHQTVVTRNVMVMHTDSIEKNLRIALAAHLAAVKRWAASYLDQVEADAVAVEGDRLADTLDAASVLEDVSVTT